MEGILINLFFSGLGFVIVPLLLLLWAIRIAREYERGVIFRLGRLMGVRGPGIFFLIPILESMVKIDLRVVTLDVPAQDVITKDNIPLRINAVIYFRIADAAKAVIAVEDYFNAVSQLAQTTMRNAVGEVKLDELLTQKKQISERIKLVVDRVSDEWGVDVQSVELKDIVLPDNLKRTIAKVAEAERERQAVIISSEGELAASENVAKAAANLSKTPGALHLRTLQSINDISSDESNTTVWMVPVEALRALEALAKK